VSTATLNHLPCHPLYRVTTGSPRVCVPLVRDLRGRWNPPSAGSTRTRPACDREPVPGFDRQTARVSWVLTYGRSLAHSVFAFAICSLAIWLITIRLRGRWTAETLPERLRIVTPGAFAIGYASHLLGDTYQFLIAGDLWAARFLVYRWFPSRCLLLTMSPRGFDCSESIRRWEPIPS